MRTTLFWVITQRVRPVGGPETSVRNYHYSLCNNLEDGSSLLCEFLLYIYIYIYIYIQGVRGGTDQTSGVFLTLNYTDITQNTYIQS